MERSKLSEEPTHAKFYGASSKGYITTYHYPSGDVKTYEEHRSRLIRNGTPGEYFVRLYSGEDFLREEVVE